MSVTAGSVAILSCWYCLLLYAQRPASLYDDIRQTIVLDVHINHHLPVRLIRDGEMGGRGDYVPITTRMTSALRWAAMRAILMFQ